VAGVCLGYIRESWYVARVLRKMVFGRDECVGLDPFPRLFGGVRPSPMVWPAVADYCWLRPAIVGYGRI
jgi:hypothetical protein